MPTESTNVFVSYSHVDVSLVSPVVKLLRVNKSLVFQDIDTIEPGKRWQGQIAEALAESQVVVVFWCTHASASNEVSNEWHAAIEQRKDLLPLLLDGTPLPPQLAEFQWIDFRGTVGANHASIDLSPIAETAAQPTMQWDDEIPMKARIDLRSLLLPICAAVFGIAAVLGWLYAFGLRSLLLALGIVFSVIVLSLTAYIIWLSRQPMARLAGPKPFVPPPPSRATEREPSAIERQIASEVEAEILRRTSLKREGGK